MRQDIGQQVIKEIEKDPSRWDQYNWTNIVANNERDDASEWKEKTEPNQVINCGTTACVAGHVSFIHAPVGTRFFNAALQLPFDPETGIRERIAYKDYAQKLLELDADEACYLFAGNRTWDEITEFINTTDNQRNAIVTEWLEDD